MIVDAQFSTIAYPSTIQGYVTGANDGKLAFYDLDGNCRELCETPPNVHLFLYLYIIYSLLMQIRILL